MTNLTKLDNGLVVASVAMPGLETAAIGVYVDTGSRYERPESAGISHLIEHMVFKGTQHRNARQIAEEIEAVGGHINAYTTRDITSFYVRLLKEDIGLGVDMLADLVVHPRFDQKELVRERDVVLQEIGQAIDTPDDLVFDHLQAAAFAGQPLGWSILGDATSVAMIGRDQLFDYHQAQYRSGNMVVAAAGAIDHDALCRMVETGFAALPTGPGGAMEAAEYKGGERIDVRPLEQVHLALALPGFSFADPDIYAAQVYAMMLGGGMSSRLFQLLREERGLAYSVFSDIASHADTGLLSVYAGTDRADVAEAAELIGAEIARMTEARDETEVARARAQLKAGLLMALESASAQSEQLGRHLLMFGRPLTTAELIAAIDAVDAAAIRRVAERLASGRLSLAMTGPEVDFDPAALGARFGG